MKVAILGCGPTGLLAAHACWMSGVDFDIFSKKRKSFLFGSQYLHTPIPRIVEEYEGEDIEYVNIGTPEEYRRKAHGDRWDGVIEDGAFETSHRGWDIRQAYERLWRRYANKITQYEIKPPVPTHEGYELLFSREDLPPLNPNYSRTVEDLRLFEYDLVISSVPRKIWAITGEEFTFSMAWVAGDAPEHGKFVPFDLPRDNQILLDGTDEVEYTRLSKVFGYTSVEWPYKALCKPYEGASQLIRPLAYVPGPYENMANQFLHVGRYGQWEKGVVASDAFETVLEAVQ